MDPMDGAVDAFHKLEPLFDTYILTTASWENPSAWSDKLEWVKRHLGDGAKKRLIITHHKDLNRGDFLVDDRTRNGAEQFGGELILFGSSSFPNWEVVVQYLRQKAS
jgi:5'(3')-deoxyribonucleotidase